MSVEGHNAPESEDTVSELLEAIDILRGMTGGLIENHATGLARVQRLLELAADRYFVSEDDRAVLALADSIDDELVGELPDGAA
jgi:hypothetical protein